MRAAILILALHLAAVTSVNAEGSVDKARLQAAMQQHIERHLIDGAFLHVDPATGDVRPLFERLLARGRVKRLP